MAYQASLNGGSSVARPEGMLTSIAELTGDVLTLAELQTRLALVDAKETADRALWPTILLVAMATVALASLPVLFLGLAFLLASALSIHQGWALVIVGLALVTLAGVVGYVAFTRFSRSFESFRRSREEFVRNVAWIQTVLTQSARPIQRSR